MRFTKRFWDFNKEILFGEFGSIIGAQVFSNFGSHIFNSINWISFSAVIGAMVGSLLWLVVRIYDTAKREKFTTKKIVDDMIYFTPVAVLFSFLIYYPILFLLSREFLTKHFIILSSVFIAQLMAFMILLVFFNLYRNLLIKKFGKVL